MLTCQISFFIIRTELHLAEDDKSMLLKKLVEAEMDGKAAGEQVIKLRESVRKLKQVLIDPT